MSAAWAPGWDRARGVVPPINQQRRRPTVNRTLSTSAQLVVVVAVLGAAIVLLSTGVDGNAIPGEGTGEDDYVGAIQELIARCVNRCPDQNQTSFTEHVDASCGSDCYIKQCTVGCRQWELALESSCQQACNVSDQELLEAREWSCIAGCNDGLGRYFRWLKAEIGTPHAPALVADSLTATALALEWEVPERLARLARYRNRGPRSYLVQWRYEEVAGDWKYCRNQSMGDSSTVRVDNLQPYTKYRFRVALLLSPHHDQVLTSEQSVIISTLPSGVPTSEPTIVRAVAVDHSRISISWEPGPFPNGPVLSYVLQIKDLHPTGYTALKEIPETSTSRHYMFEKLEPGHNYSVSVAMSNPAGEGPASVSLVATPPKPTGHEEVLLPTLILGAERSVLTQSSNLFSDPPTSVYASPDHKIRGTATHIRRGLLFVSDDAGYLYKAPSRPGAESSRVPILGPNAANNFRPTLLSVDWLNEHVYVLGQARLTQLWQIAYCDFTGGHLTVAIAGLPRRPDHFAVDPYNGFLFWVVGGVRPDAGLFRLDLGDISNGVRHEIRPQQMVRGRNLGAFALDYANFRVLVADQGNNTVLAVSLDGERLEDIRNNTQRPRFERVKSLARANGLFYWTNGTEVFAEDYHRLHNSYYHNAFPIAANNTYFSISVNQTAEQPIPIPVNPPRNLQALAAPDKLLVSWDVPYLLGVQGRGAWQSWSYQVEVGDERFATILHTATVNGTSYSCDVAGRLEPNRVYTVRAAAFTSAGQGPWSREFRVRTLRTDRQRHLVWASSDGILRSDVIGEHVDTLIARSPELDGAAVTGLAWHARTLYVVSNSTLRLYREPSAPGGEWAKVRELESVECVAIDWIGERLYYSNPAQQLIVRAGLLGEQPEPIHSVMNVREIRFDAYRGYIYCSSGLILEAFRLNGKGRVQYFSEKLFTGKQIIGMTLDHDTERLYWIVRSYSHSHLYWAPLAGSSGAAASAAGPPSPPPSLPLTDQTPQGPLLHFSDRLLWLREGQAVVGDVRGENLAYIRAQQLNGTRAFALIEPGRVVPPTVNVLPANVVASSIRVTGDWRRFNVSWAPVENVNYSTVFYKLTLKLPNARDLVQELTVPHFVYGDEDLNTDPADTHSAEREPIPPYTPIDITLHAFTYWRSSGFTSVQRHTPAGTPTSPIAPRVYIQHRYRPGTHELAAGIVFRWSPPEEPNGPIVAYRVDCWASHDDTQGRVLLDGAEVRTDRTELIVAEPVLPNATYYLQVRVRNVDHESRPSEVRSVGLRDGRPLPLLYVATSEQILLLDLDLRDNPTQIVATAVPAVLLAELRHERRLFWVNANGELFMYDDADGKRKLTQLPPPVTALAVDWVGRTVYVGNASTLHTYDLNRLEGGGSDAARRTISLPLSDAVGPIDLLQVLPDQPILLVASRISRTGYTVALDQSDPVFVPFNCTGKRPSGRKTEDLYEWVCREYERLLDGSGRRGIVQDDGYLYWIGPDGTVRMRARDDPPTATTRPFPHIGAVALLPGQQRQHYPPERCLVPVVEDVQYVPELLDTTEDSLTLRLPEAVRHTNCSGRPPAVRYRVQYQRMLAVHELNEEPTPDIHIVHSYELRLTIGNLRPYTRYRFGVTLTNHYLSAGDVLPVPPERAMPAIFTTAVGAPSRPEGIIVQPISPSEAIVSWTPSRQLNSHHVWYEIYWQTETDGHKNRQQQLVTDYKLDDTLMSMELGQLQPNQTYSVWVRAYSNVHAYSESDAFEIQTYPKPSDIEQVSVNSTAVRLRWIPPANCHKYKIQYSIAGHHNWVTLFDSLVPVPVWHNYYYTLEGLLPKTKYLFTILLHYPLREEPYLWPRDRVFLFETMADRPAAPGRPLVTHLRQDVYKVSWEPAKDNGATIEEYGLEALVSQSKRAARSVGAPDGDDEEPAGGDGLNGTVPASELDMYDEHWSQVYNGTDIYWIIPERYAIHNNLFRVRARNSYGWGPYSDESRPIDSGFYGQRTVVYIAAFACTLSMIIICVMLLVLFLIRQTEKMKNFPIDPTNTRLSDVELANLRELPRRGNFVHSTNILYSSGAMPDSEMALLPRIRSDQIYMASSSLLGSGAFGEVYEGVVKGVDGEAETRVAIKTLKKGAKMHEKQEFLQEAQLMSNFKHKHITRLLGVCLEADTLLIIMELMQGGDLLSYLRRSRSLPGQAARLTMLDLVSMCQDVASGCRYLEEMHFVHRDLACRNCLVSSVDPVERVVKIGDFGLARDIYKNDYYRKEGEGLLPVRWMSPESLVDGVFTSQSDIWAFGVLLWEIMTLGEQPYQAKNNVEVLNHVREGGHLDRPKVCPNEMYELMKYCWKFSPDERPTFRYCLEVLKTLRENTSEDTQIFSPFPAKLHQEAVSNPAYLASDSGQVSPQGSLRYHPDCGSDSGLIATPPTSSSGSSGATACPGPNTPKYLELVYEDSSGVQHGGPHTPVTNVNSMPTDNGYEIPITDSRCQQQLLGVGPLTEASGSSRPCSLAVLIPNLAVLLPDGTGGMGRGNEQAGPQTPIPATPTSSITERDDLLPRS
ncbi:proto-oncogene tyrosine-protein kinase ROS [Anopheles nili]|uniref:proto-oncogene tyrosine-protein kinase ROS n=1 Tax=Anopheles nili TaxID=185578 RepID=UPI00237A6F94|nr:proto-oncogene tyrosine-protein kinase ROS [Anopheles nili]